MEMIDMTDKLRVKFLNGSVQELTEQEVERLRDLGKIFTIIKHKPPKLDVKTTKSVKGKGGDNDGS